MFTLNTQPTRPALLLAFSTVLLLAPIDGFGQLTIDVGAVMLQPGQGSVDLFIQNTGPGAIPNIFGLNFALQVGSGSAGPKIMAVDLAVPNSVFQPYAVNQSDQGSTSWIVFYGIDTGGGGISLAGNSTTPLARVTFDTAQLTTADGPWTLSLSDVGPLHSATELVLVGGGIKPIDNINDGMLTVVPEPETYALAAGSGLLLWGFLNRRQNKYRR